MGIEYNASFKKLVNTLQKYGVWEAFKKEYMRARGITKILPSNVMNMDGCSVVRIVDTKYLSFDWNHTSDGRAFWLNILNKIRNET